MLTDFGRTLVSRVQIRRHNGQNAYGLWIALDDAEDLLFVFDAIADEIAEHDEDEGQVEIGGCRYLYRRRD